MNPTVASDWGLGLGLGTAAHRTNRHFPCLLPRTPEQRSFLKAERSATDSALFVRLDFRYWRYSPFGHHSARL